MTDRREFLKHAALITAALGSTREARALTSLVGTGGAPLPPEAIPQQAQIRALMADALNAAKTAGASFADVRIGRQRQNFVFTREQQTQNVVDTDSLGCGVRVLLDGTWGFAATRTLTPDGVASAARQAAAIARANRPARGNPVDWLAMPGVGEQTWKGAFTIDPWSISVEEKAQVLLAANAAALKVNGVKYVFSGLFFVKEERNYASTDNSIITQELVRSWPLMQITAISPDFTDFQNRGNVVQPMGRGWEYVQQCDLPGNAGKWGEDAAAKLKAKPVEVGRYDLVLHPSHLWLTIHESIGHPTELDRALGYEANYAGTSFIAPPEKMLGQLKYGPAFMNVQGDRSQEGGLSTIGYDDDGVAPETFRW
jgi:TldD protein